MALTLRLGAVSRKFLEPSRRDEDAERRKLVQEEFVGKVFGGRITVVRWLAAVLLRSSLFLSLRSSVSASLRVPLLSRLDESLCNHHPSAHYVSARVQAGKKCRRQLLRVARAQQDSPRSRQPEVSLLSGWTAASLAVAHRPFLKYPDAQVYVNTL